jgi:hypothetical protein
MYLFVQEYLNFTYFFLFASLLRYNVIPILADILSESVKEKVTRIIVATFRVSGFC